VCGVLCFWLQRGVVNGVSHIKYVLVAHHLHLLRMAGVLLVPSRLWLFIADSSADADVSTHEIHYPHHFQWQIWRILLSRPIVVISFNCNTFGNQEWTANFNPICDYCEQGFHHCFGRIKSMWPNAGQTGVGVLGYSRLEDFRRTHRVQKRYDIGPSVLYGRPRQ
jgi:hypothetical protein